MREAATGNDRGLTLPTCLSLRGGTDDQFVGIDARRLADGVVDRFCNRRRRDRRLIHHGPDPSPNLRFPDSVGQFIACEAGDW
jgi:hypothetical protein